MDSRALHLLEALGPDGLRAVLRDTFNHAHLVELANACGVKFPGKRAKAMDDVRLLDALLKGLKEDPHARPPMMKALLRANSDLGETLAATEPARIAAWVASLPSGRALFALAQDDRPEARAELKRILTAVATEDGEESSAPLPRPARKDSATSDGAGLRERIEKLEAFRAAQAADIETLKHKEVAALKEIHHLRKELAQAEAEGARLREENATLTARLQEQHAGSSAGRFEELSVRLHQIQREHKKMAHDLEEALRARPAASEGGTRPYLDALAASVESLRRDMSDVRRQIEEESHRALRSFQELAAETRMIRSDIAQWRKATAEPPPRRKGELERVGLFVDVQNMYYAARQLNARLDFGTLMNTTTRGRRLIRAVAYVVQNRDIDQTGFLAMLQQRNYEVRRKDLKIRTDGSSKGDWDMEMALDILRMAESLDIVVLVSGDGDFASLVTQIKTLGPKVEVYSFPGSTAKELIEAADKHVPIDEGFLIRMSSPA